MHTLFSCNNSGKRQDSHNRKEDTCHCEATFGTDRIIFATNIRLKKDGNRTVMLFNCATIQTAIASVSDVHGMNEREKFIYDLDCVSVKERSQELSNDFKYFTEAMQSPAEFFEALKGGEKLFFELTLEEQKITSILRVELD